MNEPIETYLAYGEQMQALKNQLWRAKLTEPIEIGGKIVTPLVLSVKEIAALEAEIWQRQLKIYLWAVNDQTERFGVPDDWLVHDLDLHRKSLLGAA